MPMKRLTSIKDIIFSFVFLFLILFIFVISIKNYKKEEISEIEMTPLEKYIFPSIGSIKNNSFQNQFEKAFSNRIIFRNEMLKINSLLNFNLQKFSHFNKKPYTLIKAGTNSYYFEANNGYLAVFPYLKNDDNYNKINNFIKRVNDLSFKYSNLNFYLFKAFHIIESDFFDSDNNFKSYGKEYRKQFLNNLSKNIIYIDNNPKDFEEYQKYYYKTDYHWNNIGADFGYRLIQKVFNDKFKEDVNPTIKDEVCFEKHGFNGIMGRESALIFGSDTYCQYEYNLNDYQLIHKNPKYINKEKYLNDSAKAYEWNNIHMDYNGDNAAIVTIKIKNAKTKRNLLVINDSFISPIKRLIAQHFDNSYFVDPRQYYENKFNVEKFIEENNITDVLFLISTYTVLNNYKAFILE